MRAMAMTVMTQTCRQRGHEPYYYRPTRVGVAGVSANISPVGRRKGANLLHSRFLSAVGWFVFLLCAAVVESSCLHIVAVSGARPDLVLLVVVNVALAYGPNRGMAIGAVGGLVQDVVGGGPIGVFLSGKVFLAYVSGKIGKRLVADHPIVMVVVVMLGSLMVSAVSFVLLSFSAQGATAARAAISTAVPQAFYNGIVTPIWFVFMRTVIRPRLGPERHAH